ncbi:MAG: RNase H superfamily protein [Chloroflexi bacterium]|nr:MAG: RNase H superfamily protein [Chloroflexota bacterium]
MNKSEKILSLDADNPALSNRQIAEAVGCTRRLVRMIRNTAEAYKGRMPKILIFDIETAPMEIYTWGLYKQHPQTHQVIKDWSLLSWSAKWLFNDTVYSQRVTGEQAIERDDSSIVKSLWALLDEADLVIGHNAAKFDVRKANLRFALNGLLPPNPYRVIDTLTHSRKVFGSSSFKMDYLNKIFGLSMKIPTNFQLWVDCVKGSNKALKEMETYNRMDVNITEELYLKLRPWMKGHPNVALYINTDETLCTNCGNEDLEWAGYYFTPAGKYRSFRCNGCGAIGRSRISDLDKESRAKLLLSVAA